MPADQGRAARNQKAVPMFAEIDEVAPFGQRARHRHDLPHELTR